MVHGHLARTEALDVGAAGHVLEFGISLGRKVGGLHHNLETTLQAGVHCFCNLHVRCSSVSSLAGWPWEPDPSNLVPGTWHEEHGAGGGT